MNFIIGTAISPSRLKNILILALHLNWQNFTAVLVLYLCHSIPDLLKKYCIFKAHQFDSNFLSLFLGPEASFTLHRIQIWLQRSQNCWKY